MLRIVVYSLLLANILLIAMRMLQPEAEGANAPARIQFPAKELPSIELAENLPGTPVTDQTTNQETALTTPVNPSELPSSAEETLNVPIMVEEQTMACIQVGPFETEASLADLKAELGEMFDRVQSRESRSIVDKGYWVYLPKYATRAQAAQVIEDMSAAGATDFYIVPDGSMTNAISLGVYERMERAEERRRQLNNLGLTLDFMIEPQTEIETRYWLEAGPVNALNPTLIELSYNNPDTQQMQVECTSGSPGTQPGVALQDLAAESDPEQEATEQN